MTTKEALSDEPSQGMNDQMENLNNAKYDALRQAILVFGGDIKTETLIISFIDVVIPKKHLLLKNQ